MYKNICRNKWLKLKPEKLTNKYYKYELDKNGNYFEAKEMLWNEIVISETNPGK